MKAYLIDPDTRRISEVTVPAHPERLTAINELLDCESITAIPLPRGDAIYVDDEGLLRGPVYQFFAVRGYPQPLAGKGLVIGTTASGDDAAPAITLDTLRLHTCFLERLTDQLWSVHPATAPRRSWLSTLDAIVRCFGTEVKQ